MCLDNNGDINNAKRGTNMDTFNLEGKVALVTGTNRGIGEAFVDTLVERGAKTVYAGIRDAQNLEHFADRYQDVVTPVHLDVTNSDHIATLAAKLSELDILVNNAGVIHGATTVSADNALSTTQEEMAVNLYGPMQLTMAMLPLLRQSKQAAIINLCSIASLSSFSTIGPYSVTKAAMHSYTQGLRNDLHGTTIQVVGVYPGPTDTRMASDFQMTKASTRQIAEHAFAALNEGQTDVFPDDFSSNMYQLFLKHPEELEKAFGEMNRL
jgi:NAD(P)-dependent dehydrogenase (short-subunit alcohol dehydrogenase family)